MALELMTKCSTTLTRLMHIETTRTTQPQQIPHSSQVYMEHSPGQTMLTHKQASINLKGVESKYVSEHSGMN